jgi:hypothetical protein
MEQRRLRLGDILDDYCPRERRVTNHAVVAMIEEDVKQTRCTTCDAEHAYKGARVPKRRKKDAPAAMPALAGSSFGLPVDAISPTDVVPPLGLMPPVDVMTPHASPEDLQPAMHSDDNDNDNHPPSENTSSPHSEPDYRERDAGEDAAPAADGPVHRPLIRATLPRPEGQKDARPAPEFTVRHAPARGNGHGNFRNDRERVRMRGGSGNGHGNGSGANGNRAQNGGSRFHGGRGSTNRPGAPSGFRSGNSGSGGKRGRGPRG